MGNRWEFIGVAIAYALALAGHIYIGDGASFAAGGVAGVFFVAYGFRAYREG